MGGLYEKVVKGGVTTQRYYIQAGQEAIAVQTNRSSGDSSDLRYLFRDHLGSVDVITDRAGVEKERFSYDAWGQRRIVRPTDDLISAVLPYRFTHHEQLDSVGLVHMNGRVYDPILSRYLSADPFVQFPKHSQSLNHYSYVLSNPLSLVDPNGLFIDDLFDAVGDFFGDVVQYVVDNPLVIVGIAVGVLTGFAVYAALGESLTLCRCSGGRNWRLLRRIDRQRRRLRGGTSRWSYWRGIRKMLTVPAEQEVALVI